MNRRNAVLSFLCSVLLVFFAYTLVSAFQAEVLPSEINSGDAFIIKVIGAEISVLRGAILNNKQFYLNTLQTVL